MLKKLLDKIYSEEKNHHRAGVICFLMILVAVSPVALTSGALIAFGVISDESVSDTITINLICFILGIIFFRAQTFLALKRSRSES